MSARAREGREIEPWDDARARGGTGRRGGPAGAGGGGAGPMPADRKKIRRFGFEDDSEPPARVSFPARA